MRVRNAESILLTTFATLCSKGVGMGVFLVATPILFNSLGELLYGMVQFTQRMGIFAGLSNFGATSYLKIRLSALDSTARSSMRRRLIGLCVEQWVLSLPILMILMWIISIFVFQDESITAVDRVALLMLVALTSLVQLLSIPQVALFSVGLGYRGVFPATVIGAIGTLVGVAGIYFGLGLLAFSSALFLGAILGAWYFLVLALREIPDFGIERAPLACLRRSFLSSLGVSLTSLANLLFQQLGMLVFMGAAGPALVGRLAITCVFVQFIELFAKQFVISSLPSIARAQASGIRDQMIAYRMRALVLTGLAFVFSSPLAIWLSRPIIDVWVGEDAFISESVVCSFLVAGYLRTVAHFDGIALDQARRYYWRATAAAVICAAVICISVSSLQNESSEVLAIAVVVAVAIYFLIVSILFASEFRTGMKLEFLRLSAVLISVCSVIGMQLLWSYITPQWGVWPTFSIAAPVLFGLGWSLPVVRRELLIVWMLLKQVCRVETQDQ